MAIIKPAETSQTYQFNGTVEVNGEATILATKIVHKSDKNTIKISANVTTKQIDLKNDEINSATAKQLAAQILSAILFSKKLILEKASTEGDAIKFVDADE